MDYRLNVYPSSALEMKNFKANNATKQIKMVVDNKLPVLYKKSFGAAVKKFNETAISGRLIEDYYKSIVNSNVPEVYCIDLLVRYELLNKNEVNEINKIFGEFKKVFEKAENLQTVAIYHMSFEEYKEMQIFFYPVVPGYITGLNTRNDLIDFVRHTIGTKDNMNIKQAMVHFTKYVDDLFSTVNEGKITSQAELEAQANRIQTEDPLLVHAIAVDALKMQMNALQKLSAENDMLQNAINESKIRIEKDLRWSKEMVATIQLAEKERIIEEKRRADEALRLEQQRRAEEAQRREEERLREEARRLEAEKYAALAKRNLELQRQMEQKQAEEQRRQQSRINISQDSFTRLVEQHVQWQQFYNITKTTDISALSVDAAEDPRRMVLTNANLKDIALEINVELIGIVFDGCELINCKIRVDLTSARIDDTILNNTSLENLSIENCSAYNLHALGARIENVTLLNTIINRGILKHAHISKIMSAPGNSFAFCDFSNAIMNSCDMKKNAFTNCDFTDAVLTTCDMRNASFQVCKMERLRNEGSLFRKTQIS